MRWPWSKGEPEKRQSVPFSDAVVAALTAQASGQAVGDASGIAALEAATALYARAFAAVRLSPAVPALSPGCLALIARNLIRRGEDVHQIMVDGGMVRLQPIGSWDVRGGPVESSWWYRCDRFGPSGNLTEFVPAGAVLHVRYAVDSARPWYGLAPLQWARSTGTLAANLETRLGEEAGSSVGYLLPVPADGGDGSDSNPLAGLKADIANLRGRHALVETTAAGWGEGRTAAPQSDYRPQRIGAHPPESLPTLRTQAAESVLSACGVPVSLVTDADGTSQREAWRRFVMGSVEPLLEIVGQEIEAKLETRVTFDLSRLWAHDLAGRASSFKGMVTAGMEIERAAALSGTRRRGGLMTIRWRPGEDAILRTDDIEAILELKRSRRAIYLRRHRLGLPLLGLPPVRRSLRYWSPAENAAVLAARRGRWAISRLGSGGPPWQCASTLHDSGGGGLPEQIGGVQRFIPARAGNGIGPQGPAGAQGVHPRAGGERARIAFSCREIFGSSPRGRGTVPESGVSHRG